MPEESFQYLCNEWMLNFESQERGFDWDFFTFLPRGEAEDYTVVVLQRAEEVRYLPLIQASLPVWRLIKRVLFLEHGFDGVFLILKK